MAAAKTKNFETLLEALPYKAITKEGAGFLPPYLRMMNHLLVMLQAIPESTEKAASEKLDVEFLKSELTDATNHFKNITLNSYLTNGIQSSLKKFADLLILAQTDLPNWSAENASKNIIGMINRAMGIAAAMDQELIGLTNSDAGTQI